MNTFRIEIAGDPVAKARARSARIRGKIIHYDEQEDKKNYIKLLLRQRINENPEIQSYFESASVFHIDMTFHMPYPSSFSKRQIIQYELGEYKHAQKPDLDNLVKFYLDCCNKIIFEDDQKVISLNLKKMYSEIAKTIIEIRAEK
jgi:Holliday junction resolvase RusA-like endonuclease